MTGYPPWWAGLAPLIPETTDPRIATGVEGVPPGQPVSWRGAPGAVPPWQPTEQELARWGDSIEIFTSSAENPLVMLCDVGRLRVPQALYFTCSVSLLPTSAPWTVPIEVWADLGIGRGRQRGVITTFVPDLTLTQQSRAIPLAARTCSIFARFKTTTPANPERARIVGGIGLFGGGM